MMEQFTKELNELLMKYPDLPEFSLTVRPRLSIQLIKPAVQTTTPTSTAILNTVQVPMVGETVLPPMGNMLKSIQVAETSKLL